MRTLITVLFLFAAVPVFAQSPMVYCEVRDMDTEELIAAGYFVEYDLHGIAEAYHRIYSQMGRDVYLIQTLPTNTPAKKRRPNILPSLKPERTLKQI